VTVRIQTADFDVSAEIAALGRDNPKIGAVASFVGIVRDVNDGDAIVEMSLEHYPGMTEQAIGEIVTQARGRWRVFDALVIHRVVLVVVAGEHRSDAFAACEFIMDYLKTRAPFWKKETTEKGERWVEARASDDIAAERWRLKG
jgi:molybdopterin synthase catalytic subunit